MVSEGFLSPASASNRALLVEAFRAALRELADPSAVQIENARNVGLTSGLTPKNGMAIAMLGRGICTCGAGGMGMDCTAWEYQFVGMVEPAAKCRRYKAAGGLRPVTMVPQTAPRSARKI